MLPKKTIQSIFTKYLNVGIIIGLGLIGANPTPLLALPLESEVSPKTTVSVAQATTNTPLADGVYLYGQSATPDAIGSEYLVFEVRQGQVAGASYMPYSEFACFSGSIDAKQMNVSVVDPYDPSQVYPVSIALEELSPVAATGDHVQRDVGLEGYHRLDQLSDNDQRILGICMQKDQQ